MGWVRQILPNRLLSVIGQLQFRNAKMVALDVTAHGLTRLPAMIEGRAANEVLRLQTMIKIFATSDLISNPLTNCQ